MAIRPKATTNAKKTTTAKTVKKTAKTAAKTTKKTTQRAKKEPEEVQKAPERYAKTAKEPSVDLEKKRKRLVKNEVRRLNDCFREIPSEKRRLVKATIEDAAFLTVTMQELREKIAREGTEIEYKNGENQYGTKQSPAVATYNQMSQKLAAAMKILLECQPKTEQQEKDDKMDDFIVMRGDD